MKDLNGDEPDFLLFILLLIKYFREPNAIPLLFSRKVYTLQRSSLNLVVTS